MNKIYAQIAFELIPSKQMNQSEIFAKEFVSDAGSG